MSDYCFGWSVLQKLRGSVRPQRNRILNRLADDLLHGAVGDGWFAIAGIRKE